MIALVVAMADNNAIGKNNQLLWHISEDLQFFKKLTLGGTVIMGRKTYESIGKPLPKRRNIVITRTESYLAAGAEIVHSLEEALSIAESDEKVFIIGGGEIYRQAINSADMLYITKVDRTYDADTFFPDIEHSQWKEVDRVDFERGATYEYPFSFFTYKKL